MSSIVPSKHGYKLTPQTVFETKKRQTSLTPSGKGEISGRSVKQVNSSENPHSNVESVFNYKIEGLNLVITEAKIGDRRIDDLQGKSFSSKDLMDIKKGNASGSPIDFIIPHIDELVKDLNKSIARHEASITLGFTDIGHVAADGSYVKTSPDNITHFTEGLGLLTNYTSWDEFDQWEVKDAQIDWSEVMYTRFNRVLEEDAQIHFNIAGFETDIDKIKSLNYNQVTGSSGETLYADLGWAQTFGHYGITQWELAQVLNNKVLFDKTTFYNYDKTKTPNEGPKPLTADELTDFGIELLRK